MSTMLLSKSTLSYLLLQNLLKYYLDHSTTPKFVILTTQNCRFLLQLYSLIIPRSYTLDSTLITFSHLVVLILSNSFDCMKKLKVYKKGFNGFKIDWLSSVLLNSTLLRKPFYKIKLDNSLSYNII